MTGLVMKKKSETPAILATYLKDLLQSSKGKEEIIEIVKLLLKIDENTKKTLKELFLKLQKLSKSDGPCQWDATFLLGVCYFEGKIIEADKELAVEHFKNAAEKNIPSALYCLGNWYSKSESKEEQEQGCNLYLKAAELNFILAYDKLGEHYKDKDFLKACEMYQYAIKRGVADTADLRDYLINLIEKSSENIEVYEKKANEGDCLANLIVGYKYFFGEGDKIKEDAEKAVPFLEKAAELGYKFVYKEFGRELLDKDNIKLGLKYLILASENGFDVDLEIAEIYDLEKDFWDTRLALKYYVSAFINILEEVAYKNWDDANFKNKLDELNTIKKLQDYTEKGLFEKASSLLSLYERCYDKREMYIKGIKIASRISVLIQPSKIVKFFEETMLPEYSQYAPFTKEFAIIFREYEFGDELEKTKKEIKETKELKESAEALPAKSCCIIL